MKELYLKSHFQMMLKLPENDLIYFRQKIPMKKAKEMAKKINKGRSKKALVVSIIFAIIPYILFQHFEYNNILAILMAGIVSTAIILCNTRIPTEWAIGNEGIYLFYLWNGIIKWYHISEITEGEEGFLIKIGKCRKFYLITDKKNAVREILKQFTVLVQGI